jgi:hypothetical protein
MKNSLLRRARPTSLKEPDMEEASPLRPQRPARERNAALCAKILQDNSSSDEKEKEEAADTGCFSATSNVTGTSSPTDNGKLFCGRTA